LWTLDNAHKNDISGLALSSDCRFFCTGGDTGEIRVWDFQTKKLRSHLKEHIQKITKLHLFSNEVHLLSSARDKVILIWDLNKEKIIANYQQSNGGVNNFQFHPFDENMLFTVGQDKKIKQWDLRHPQPVNIIVTHPPNKLDMSDEIFGLSISHDGQYLAAGGASGTVRIYDINTSSLINQVFAHTTTCTGLLFTHDDQYVVSVGDDSQILSFKFK
jgi:WD40 repeat protein